MVEYNKRSLNENRHTILCIYIDNLKDLQKGEIPSLFETRSEWLRQALPYFFEDDRKKYQKVLNVGLQQFNFIREPQAFNSLKNGEESRKKTIENFLKSVKDYHSSLP